MSAWCSTKKVSNGRWRGHRRWFAVLVVAVGIALGGTACSADDPSAGEGDELTEDVGDLAAPPSPEVVLDPDRGEPPAALRVEDLVAGSGEAVEEGDELLVEYLGLRWSDGQEFASSWAAGEPLTLELGAGRVIEGWERGILGTDLDVGPLQVGGRRLVTIPPELAYDDRGAGSAVGPDETLVFVIDLLAIEAA